MKFIIILKICLLLLVSIPQLQADFISESTTQFMNAPSMVIPRMNHHIIVDEDDEVTVFAGHGVGFRSLDSAEYYQTQGDDFVVLNMLHKHDDPAFVRLANGEYLIMGGSRDWGIPHYSHTQIYNPETREFRSGGDLVRFRAGSGSALLNNGQVLVVGAWWTHNTAHTYGEVYDPVTNTFSSTSAFAIRRSHPIVIGLKDGRGIVFGGVTESGIRVDMPVEVFDPISGQISTLQALMFEDEPGWNVVKSKRLNETHLLDEHLYLFTAWKQTDNYNEYRLFTFNADTLDFEWVETSALPTSESIHLFDHPFISENKQAAYQLGTIAESDLKGQFVMVSVNLIDGKVYLSEHSFDAKYGLYGAAGILLQGDKILVTGGTSDGSNFNPVANSFYVQTMSFEDDTEPEDPKAKKRRGLPVWLYIEQ